MADNFHSTTATNFHSTTATNFHSSLLDKCGVPLRQHHGEGVDGRQVELVPIELAALARHVHTPQIAHLTEAQVTHCVNYQIDFY